MDHDGIAGELEAALETDPENLELAWKYWNVLSSWHGADIRSGMYVFRAFRAAALKSPHGVLAFAQAYRELFRRSGEGPRKLDAGLASVVRASLSSLPPGERAEVQWLLDCIAEGCNP